MEKEQVKQVTTAATSGHHNTTSLAAATALSPTTSNNELTSQSPKKTIKLPAINANALSEIERDASVLARDFYKLARQLQLSLNHISAASVCCMQTYRDSVDKACTAADECVKEEHRLLAKSAELTREMAPVYRMQAKVAAIKNSLALLETHI